MKQINKIIVNVFNLFVFYFNSCAGIPTKLFPFSSIWSFRVRLFTPNIKLSAMITSGIIKLLVPIRQLLTSLFFYFKFTKKY